MHMHAISPVNITTNSRRQVLRIKKNIIYEVQAKEAIIPVDSATILV